MFRDIIMKAVMMGSHVGGGTSVCIPINTCIKLQWVQRVRMVKRAKAGMSSRLRDR